MSYLYHSLLNQSSFFELLVFFFCYIYRQAWMIFVHFKLFFCSLGWCGAFIPFTQVTPCISTLNLSIIFLECFPIPSRLQLILLYTVLACCIPQHVLQFVATNSANTYLKKKSLLFTRNVLCTRVGTLFCLIHYLWHNNQQVTNIQEISI